MKCKHEIKLQEVIPMGYWYVDFYNSLLDCLFSLDTIHFFALFYSIDTYFNELLSIKWEENREAEGRERKKWRCTVKEWWGTKNYF